MIEMHRESEKVAQTHQEKVDFNVLSPDQVRHIHRTALEILERTGVEFYLKEARELLEDAGCRVEGERVYFPPALVEWAIDIAPSGMTLFNRDGDDAMFIGGDNVTFGPGPTLLNMRDFETGERREFTKQDTVNVARLCDSLENIDWVMGFGTISDVPTEHSDRHEFEAMVKNTKKPIVVWSYTDEGMKDIIDMAIAVRGGKKELAREPFIISLSAPISPLAHNEDSLKRILLSAENQIPLVHAPATQGGANAPITISGQLAQGTAENLSGLVLTQLAQEGLPYFFGGVASIMDMKTAIFSYGAPEKDLAMAGYMDIAEYYELPTWGTGGCSDSKVFDQQSIIEGSLSALVSALSGANLVHDVGYLESASTGSLEQIVAVDEAVGMARRFIDGIEINDHTLALDVIDEVGHGGNFSAHQQRANNFKKGAQRSTLLDRTNRGTWEEKGSKTFEQRAHEKVIRILEEHEPTSLPDDVGRKIDGILDRL